MDWQQRKAKLLKDSSVVNRLLQSLDDDIVFSKARDTFRMPRAIGLPKRRKFSETDGALIRRLNKIATGAQPAVVKLVSYGGAKRLNNMLNYISREGGIKIETYTGEEITDKELLTVPKEWSPLFDDREMSRDIGNFTISFENAAAGAGHDDIINEILATSFGDRRFAYRVDAADDKTRIEGVVVLRSKMSGERLTADKVATEIIHQKLSKVFPHQNVAFSFHGYGNGVEYGESRLTQLLAKGRPITTDERVVLTNKDEAKQLVTSIWRAELCSRKPRDVLHLMISARAGTDVTKFTSSVRHFLGTTFGEGGHKYVFAIHDPVTDVKRAEQGGKRPHVHAHAIITAKNIYGDRLSINRDTFKLWRVAMADAATRNGIEMVMTDRRDTLAAPAYTRKDARPVGYSEGQPTVYEGITKSGEARLEQKLANKIIIPHSNVSTAYYNRIKDAYTNILNTTHNAGEKEFSEKIIQRFEHGKKRSVAKTKQDIIREIREGINNMANAPLTFSGFNQYRENVDKSLERLHSRLSTKDRAEFDELAKSANNVIKTREAAIKAQDRLDRARFGDTAVEQGNVIIADIEKQKQQSDGSSDKTDSARQLDKTYRYAVNVAVRDNNQYLQEQLSRIPETQAMLQARAAKEPQQKPSRTTEERER